MLGQAEALLVYDGALLLLLAYLVWVRRVRAEFRYALAAVVIGATCFAVVTMLKFRILIVLCFVVIVPGIEELIRRRAALAIRKSALSLGLAWACVEQISNMVVLTPEITLNHESMLGQVIFYSTSFRNILFQVALTYRSYRLVDASALRAIGPSIALHASYDFIVLVVNATDSVKLKAMLLGGLVIFPLGLALNERRARLAR